MSFSDGMAAINLEKTSRIPRTEYSAHFHWDLVNKVIGSNINSKSPSQEQHNASSKFIQEWNYDIHWNTLIHNQIFGDKYTKMGHAEYNQGGTDFNNDINQLYDEPEDALKFDPYELYGKVDMNIAIKNFNEDYKRQIDFLPNCVPMTGIYATLMSGLIEVFGWDTLIMACGIDSVAFGEVANRYSNWISQYFEALAKSDAKVVMMHDDITWTNGAFLNPKWYRKYIFPNYKKMLAPLIESGKKIIYTSDGTYTEFVDDIAACGVNGFVLEPTTDLKYIVDNYGKTHCIVGNVDTRILLSGTREDIYNEVKRCIDIGKNANGFIMAVGNHIPPNTPVENALYYNDCYEKLSRR